MTYQYLCEFCNSLIEVQRTLKEYETSVGEFCEKCGKITNKRVYTPVGIIFKGSGFYVNDNKIDRKDD